MSFSLTDHKAKEGKKGKDTYKYIYTSIKYSRFLLLVDLELFQQKKLQKLKHLGWKRRI